MANTQLSKNHDGRLQVYLLYRPEYSQGTDPNIYLWVRRCEVFASSEDVIAHFKRMGIEIATIELQHELFPQLTTITDTRGYKWYSEKAPIYGL